MQRIIFIHIPKAAGTSLQAILSNQHDASRTFTIYEHVANRIEEFKNLSQERRRHFTLVVGHMPIGLHEYFPDSVYITMLRRPVDRVVSHYNYALAHPGHYLHEQARKMSLEDYVQSGISAELDNGQVRLLADRQTVPFGQCSRDTLDLAKANLARHFAAVGIAERFDEFVALLKLTFGWESVPYYARLNVSKPKSSGRRVPDSVVRLIGSHNQLDSELYEWVKSRIEQAVAPFGRKILYEMWKLRLVNMLKSPFVRPIRKAAPTGTVHTADHGEPV